MVLTFRLNGGLTGLDLARAKWGGFATKYIKWGEKQAVKYADEIIVLSRSVQEYFEKRLNCDYLVHLIIDYSTHNPITAGFDKIIFIIQHDIEEDFKAVIGEFR